MFIKVYIAIDNVGGMMFNNRRQSQDRFLREYLLKCCENCRLWINEYTASQFEKPLPTNVLVDNKLLNKVGDDDSCFVENLFLNEYRNKIEFLILFKWNKSYPSDMKLDIDLSNWKLLSCEEFAGYSHEVITMEVWKNEEYKKQKRNYI